MNRTAPFVDIHCHLLPGLDDGARDDAEALAMAEMAAADGFSTIIATPHQLGHYAHNDAAAIRAGVDRLQRILDERGIPLQVLPGADVRIEADLLSKLRSGEVLTLADRRRHVLLELPHEIYIPLDPLLDELAAAGLAGILSHPERNRGIISQPHVLQPLVQRGCFLQVTAGSISGDVWLAHPWIQRMVARTSTGACHCHRRTWRGVTRSLVPAGFRSRGETVWSGCRPDALLPQSRPRCSGSTAYHTATQEVGGSNGRRLVRVDCKMCREIVPQPSCSVHRLLRFPFQAVQWRMDSAKATAEMLSEGSYSRHVAGAESSR